MTGLPATLYQAVGVAAAGPHLYALRNDGAVFILFKRGDLLGDGTVVRVPHWAPVPAIPGTLGELDQEGAAPVPPRSS